MSGDKTEEYRSVFKAFDANGDGKISAKELSTMLYSLNLQPTEEDLQNIMSDADANKNGYLDFDEFVKLVEKMPVIDYGEDEMKAAFAAFDTDGNGTLDKEELKTALTSSGLPMTQDEVDGLFNLADTNKDGVIQYKEFVKLMCDLTG